MNINTEVKFYLRKKKGYFDSKMSYYVKTGIKTGSTS